MSRSLDAKSRELDDERDIQISMLGGRDAVRAAGMRFDFMDRNAGITVLLILPILAVMTMRRCCFGTGEAA